MIDRDFVPVWIDVRTTPLPRLPFVDEILVNARVDADNKVIDPFSRGFFLRTAVLAPDGALLNRGRSTVAGALATVIRDGDNGYAALDPGDYLVMLDRALARWRAR